MPEGGDREPDGEVDGEPDDGDPDCDADCDDGAIVAVGAVGVVDPRMVGPVMSSAATHEVVKTAIDSTRGAESNEVGTPISETYRR